MTSLLWGIGMILIQGATFYFAWRQMHVAYGFRAWTRAWVCLMAMICFMILRRVTGTLLQAEVIPVIWWLGWMDRMVLPAVISCCLLAAMWQLSRILTMPVRDLAAGLDPAIISITPESVVVGWDHRAERLFGWTAAEAMGRSLTDLVVPQRLIEAHFRGVRRAVDQGVSIVIGKHYVTTAINKAGEEFPVEILVVPQQVEGVLTFSGAVSRLLRY